MIVKTDAIVANIWPFSETSHVVSWLTADYGRISTIIKGAQRPRNFFLGQYDLFYTCELLFYLRLFQGLHIVKECFPLKPRERFRTDWRGTACASYFTGLTAKMVPLYAPHKNIYLLLDKALDFFASGKNVEVGLYWFEIKLLSLLGFMPVLNACLQCRRPLVANGVGRPAAGGMFSVAFSAARGGVLCPRCSGGTASMARIAPDTLALLRFWQSLRNIEAVRNIVCDERQKKNVALILGSFLKHHLETENIERDIALAVLKKQPMKEAHDESFASHDHK
jgi:DNA repair protein RecO (recombination protein O)